MEMNQQNTSRLSPARRHPRSGSANPLQDAHDAFIIELFNRKALFDLQEIDSGPSIKALQGQEELCQLTYFEHHLFLVTAHLRPNASFYGQTDTSSSDAIRIVSAFKRWYLNVCRELLGPKFNKKVVQQPFTLAFLDVEGSRYGAPATTFQNPHIHALMLVHPWTAERAERALQSVRAVDPELGAIDVKRFNDMGHGLASLATYASKYARRCLTNGAANSLLVLPDLNKATYPFYGKEAA